MCFVLSCVVLSCRFLWVLPLRLLSASWEGPARQTLAGSCGRWAGSAGCQAGSRGRRADLGGRRSERTQPVRSAAAAARPGSAGVRAGQRFEGRELLKARMAGLRAFSGKSWVQLEGPGGGGHWVAL